MKKLISMIEFTEDIESYVNESQNFERGCRLLFYYKDFLSEPLTLGMFIPTDENGIVLEEPKNYEIFDYEMSKGQLGYGVDDKIYSDSNFINVEKYFKAKDRVIFEGFEYSENKYNGNKLFNKELNFTLGSWNLTTRTIEDLVKYNLTITETAVKKYGL